MEIVNEKVLLEPKEYNFLLFYAKKGKETIELVEKSKLFPKEVQL